jgi:hypothetical protein
MPAIPTITWANLLEVMRQPDLIIGLAGPPGIGKTAGCFEIGSVLKKITQKVQSTPDLTPAEALGFYVPKGDKFEWMAGPIDVCYREGGMLIIDEIAEASGPLKTFLYGALDRGPGGTISYVGRTFKQAPGYQAIATMNEYPDQGSLPLPVLDRFDAWFLVTEPSEPLYRMLDSDLQDICRDCYATSTRDPMLGPSVTFRMLLGYQKLRKLPVLTMEQAVSAACYGNATLAQSLLEVLILEKGREIIPGVAPSYTVDPDMTESAWVMDDTADIAALS